MANYIDTPDGLAVQGEIVSMTEARVGAKNYEVVILDVKSFNDGKTYQVEFFNRDIPKDINQYRRGDAVEVDFSISQRAYNGRTYTKLAATGIARIANSAPATEEKEAANEQIPF